MKNTPLRTLALLLILGSSIFASQTDPVTLEPGKPIERNIAGGEAHSYTVTLAAGMYTVVDVDQRGINVGIKIFAADGQKLREADFAGPGASERLSLLADGAVSYRVEVSAPDKTARLGAYAIELKEIRPATDQDKNRVDAEKLMEAGMQLIYKQTAESRQEAIQKFQQSLPFWRAANDKSKEADAFYIIAYTFNRLGRFQEAIDAAEQGLPLARAANDRGIEAFLLDQIGSSYFGRGERRKALEFFLQALPLRSEKDPVGLGTTLNNIGLAYAAIGERAKALGYMEQAVTLMEKQGDRLKASTVLGNICFINNALSLYKKALDACNQGLKMKRDINDRSGQGITLNTLGTVYTNLGDYQNALDIFQQSRKIHQELGQREDVGIALNNMGLVYVAVGEYEKAIDFYTQALEVLRDDYKHRTPTALGNLGAAYAAMKDFRKALEFHLQVLPLKPESEDREGRAIALNNVANSYANLSDKQKALEYYTQALALHRSVGNLRLLATALRNIGTFHRDQGETAKALDYLNEARTITSTIGDRNGEANVLSQLAKLELSRGNLVEARRLIEDAITTIESLRVNLKSHQLRASFLASVRKYYEFDIDVLMRLHQQRPAEGFATAALQVSEKSRARSLLELLREARAEIRHGVDASLIEREDNLRRTIADRADQQTRLLSGKYTDEQATAAAKEIETLTTEYDQVQSRIRQTSPRYAALIEPLPIDVAAIQKQIDDDTLLLEYALGDEKSFVWAVTPDSVKSFELPGRATVEQAAKRFYQLLTERGLAVSGETLAQRKQRLDQADAEYPKAAAELSRMLLGPVAAELKRKRLVIVSEGVLQYVPFSALPMPAGQPLIVDHEIVTLPSASVLAVLREEFASRKSAGKTVAVFADPVFSASDSRLTQASTSETPPSIEAQRSAAESGLADLVRLRFSRQEAEEIARLSSDSRNLKALDFSANRSTATDAKLGDYRIVHFATHGLINNQNPDLSGVVLSLVDEQGRPQNGFLRLYDIYNLKLNADLVVLSACQTALGKEIRGEGLVGLTRGFMYAGAPRVVASFWRIDDRATADIMRRFYEAMLKDGLRQAAALRAAQLSMWREKRWQSPHYWAAFTIQGEWR